MGRKQREFDDAFTKRFVSGLAACRSGVSKEDKIAAIQSHKEEVQGNKEPVDKKLDFAAMLKAKAANKSK
ncbi:MAG: hypothetical protein KAJ75_09180 [Alphaproteobacteria bacterium]|nr:hypothetical protein [Alphaproteobacteria bacterium]